MKYFYGNNNFYPTVMQAEYEVAGSWPETGVGCEEDVFSVYAGEPPIGQLRGTDSDGMPCWVDAPAPTQAELVARADNQKQALLNEANTVTDDWRTELALGIISDEDKASLITWMQYIKAVKAVDTSKAPQVTWPVKPTK